MWMVLARFAGLQAASRLSARLPLVWGWLLAVAVTVVVNASPILALQAGEWGVHDVVLFYAIENVLLVVTVTVRLLTYRAGASSRVGMFGRLPGWLTGSDLQGLVFGMVAGIFTLVGTIFAFVGAATNGLTGSASSWLVNLVLLVAGHLLSLAFFWFGQGQRNQVTSAWPMVLAAVPRVLTLHLFAIFVSFQPEPFTIPLVVWVVVVVKVVWDLGLLVAQLVLRLRGGS